MTTDTWHYPRAQLAEQVLGMFETGLSYALVFFAPRRMGKTEFLCKDILPLAEQHGWKVLYFSFLDIGSEPAGEFIKALAQFAERAGTLRKARKVLRGIKKITGEAGGIKAGIELHDSVNAHESMKEVMERLHHQEKVLLLLDEVQVLAQEPGNVHFVAAFRTALDIYKDTIKVIFTGSSQEGLRRMFSQAKAPFFHFGQNLPFPLFDQGFTDHLARMFEKVTGRKLARDKLWDTFEKMQKVPQLARSLVERLALNPNLSIEEAQHQLMADVFDDRAFSTIWDQCSPLERLLLCEIVSDDGALFSAEIRIKLAKTLGITELSVSSIQSSIRTLQRKGLIGRLPERSGYFIDDPNFKNWLLHI